MAASGRVRATTLVLLALTASLAAAGPDEDLLHSQKIATDGPSLLEFFRQRTLSQEDTRRIADLVQKLGSRSFTSRERASQALRELGAPARPFLRAALENPDPEVVRRARLALDGLDQGPGPQLPAAAARVLARKAPEGAAAVLIAYAPFAENEGTDEGLLEALEVLAAPGRKLDPALLAALKDDSPARRAMAAYALGRHTDATVRAAVRPLLEDRDERVRFHAAQALALGGERTAVPVLVTLLGELPLVQAWQAEELLFRLAGDKAPLATLADGSAEVRKKCRDAWRDWWTRNGERVDLAGLREGRGLLGLTLGIEYNTNRVWECSPDGTVRWEISTQGPMEAWVLPGNRVLIADQAGVTERDFKGKVLWKLEGTSGATGAQRLPNGNTFVSTYSSVAEYNRDRKQVYQHSIRGSNAIRKARNGNVIHVADRTLIEMNTSGKNIREITIPQGFWVGLQDLPSGRFLLADSSRGRVIEVDGTGKVLWEAAVAGATGVERLPNGRTLVSTSGRVVEVDRSGKIVWEKKVTGYVRRVHRR